MEQDHSLWEHFGGGRLLIDAIILALLGLLEYAFLSHPASIRPGEGAILVMAFAGLLILGRRGFSWQRELVRNAIFPDWAARVVAGNREPVQLPQGLSGETGLASKALNAVLADVQEAHQTLAGLKEAVIRDWREVDKSLTAVQAQRARDRESQVKAAERVVRVGLELRAAFEDTLQLDRIELDQRLRADQWRLQAQAFMASLEQVKGGLDQFESLVEELRDTFPRLLREGDALGRLANSGMRQAARLGMAVRGLVAHTPRLMEEAHSRTEQFRHFRKAADELRDQAEALGRRMEGFRSEALDRTRAFGGVQGSLKAIDEAAQQAGLLAVNAAILSQQGSGAAGVQAIGGRLRHLAGQTSRGVSEVERAIEEHSRGLEHETAGLWDLQEVTESLLAGIQNLLRSAGHLDQQGQEMERLLDTQVVQVDQVREMSERAELALHEVGERSQAIEAAMGRLWAVEAKLLSELERLARSGGRLSDAGKELSTISRQNIEEIWKILGRHQEIRRTDAYRQVMSGELGRVLDPPPIQDGAFSRLAWMKSRRLSRLAGSWGPPVPLGRRDAEGSLRIRLLGLDALGMPEPSALQQITWSREGREWRLDLREELRAEDHRMGLLEALRHSDLEAWFPGLQTRITPEGAVLIFPWAFSDLPRILAGLALDLALGLEGWEGPLRTPAPLPEATQAFLWAGPDLDSERGHLALHGIHGLVQEIPDHHLILPQGEYEGERPPCQWLGEPEQTIADLSDSPSLRFLSLGGAEGCLSTWRDRVLQGGGQEGAEGPTLVAVRIAPVDPVVLLLQLFRRDAGLAGCDHPSLVTYRQRLQSEVLAVEAQDPLRAGWSLLEAFQSEGWLLPLPPV